MVLAAWLEEKLERSRAAHRAERIAEGRAMADREWEDWNRRYEAALERGDAFAEPPPSHFRSPARG